MVPRPSFEVWCGQENRAATSGSSAEPILKQSRRELPTTDPPTRAPDEALQISWACTALSRGTRHPQCSFPPQTTFTFCRELSSGKAASIRDMAGDHRSLTSAWNTTPARRTAALSKPFKPIQRLSHRNVTVPDGPLREISLFDDQAIGCPGLLGRVAARTLNRWH